MKALAVLLAAGRGERMHAARPKAFLPLGGQPLLLRAALAFESASTVEGIIVVVPAAMVPEAHDILSPVRALLAKKGDLKKEMAARAAQERSEARGIRRP